MNEPNDDPPIDETTAAPTPGDPTTDELPEGMNDPTIMDGELPEGMDDPTIEAAQPAPPGTSMTAMDDPTSTPAHVSFYVSPTITNLPSDQRPNPSTVCETCPASVWFKSPVELKCYCRVMHLVTWGPEEKTVLKACDGREAAIEAMLAQMADG